MESGSDRWLQNQMRLKYAEDFQAMEAFKMAQARGRSFFFLMFLVEVLMFLFKFKYAG